MVLSCRYEAAARCLLMVDPSRAVEGLLGSRCLGRAQCGRHDRDFGNSLKTSRDCFEELVQTANHDEAAKCTFGYAKFKAGVRKCT